MKRREEEEQECGGRGGLCHCLLSFFHPQHRHNQHITHSNTPYNCSFPLPFSFQLLLFFSISSSLSPPPPKKKSSQRIPFSFLSQPWWKCKHLRQTEVRGRGERQSSLINWRLCVRRWPRLSRFRARGLNPTEGSHRGAIITQVKTSFSLCLTGAVWRASKGDCEGLLSKVCLRTR